MCAYILYLPDCVINVLYDNGILKGTDLFRIGMFGYNSKNMQYVKDHCTKCNQGKSTNDSLYQTGEEIYNIIVLFSLFLLFSSLFYILERSSCVLGFNHH